MEKAVDLNDSGRGQNAVSRWLRTSITEIIPLVCSPYIVITMNTKWKNDGETIGKRGCIKYPCFLKVKGHWKLSV